MTINQNDPAMRNPDQMPRIPVFALQTAFSTVESEGIVFFLLMFEALGFEGYTYFQDPYTVWKECHSVIAPVITSPTYKQVL